MKYLRKYYENKESSIIEQTIDDICSDLISDKFRIKTNIKQDQTIHVLILYTNINTKPTDCFYWEEVNNEVRHAINFLQDEGYCLSKIFGEQMCVSRYSMGSDISYYRSNFSNTYYQLNPDLDDMSGILIRGVLNLKFCKMEKRVNESVIEFHKITDDEKEVIREICYDITDDGFFKINTGYVAKNSYNILNQYRLDDLTNYIQIRNDSGNNSTTSPFNISEELRNVINRLKSYLGDRFIHFSMVVRDNAGNRIYNYSVLPPQFDDVYWFIVWFR